MPIRRAQSIPEVGHGADDPRETPEAGRGIGRDASRPFGLEASGAPLRKGPLAVEASLPCGPCRGDAMILAGIRCCLSLPHGFQCRATGHKPHRISCTTYNVLARSRPQSSSGPSTIGGAPVSRASDHATVGSLPSQEESLSRPTGSPVKADIPLESLEGSPGCLESRHATFNRTTQNQS
jgi:hypothetical protein